MARIFIDTNILVYTIDSYDKEKQRKSRKLLKEIAAEGNPVISTQVLQEFYNAATMKLKTDKLIAKNMMHGFGSLDTVQVDLDIIEQAVDISILSEISFWDSLIIAAAEAANCSVLLSEDLADGQVIRGIKITNPFK